MQVRLETGAVPDNNSDAADLPIGNHALECWLACVVEVERGGAIMSYLTHISFKKET